MPQISLNITLTDEQYQQLMEQSSGVALNDPEVVAALKDIIVNHMGEYLKHNSQLIEKCFHTYNGYYNWKEENLNETTKAIVKDAAKDCTDRLKKAVEEYMMDIAKTTKLDDYFHLLLSDAILRGCVSGLENWKNEMTILSYNNTHDLRRLNERLGVESY